MEITTNSNVVPITVRVASPADADFAQMICDEMESSAKARGTGIAKRAPEYIVRKMEEGKAVIAFTDKGEWVGFCYIEAWEHEKYVANSGLIVAPQFRHTGVARRIKQKIFELSREKYPQSRIFGLTTGLAVMKINSELGYKPVTYSELTTDEEFWKGCRSCVNFDILTIKERKNCICTAMLFDPAWEQAKVKTAEAQQVSLSKSLNGKRRKKREFKGNFKLFERWVRYKQFVLVKSYKNRMAEGNQPSKSDAAAQPAKKRNGIFFW